MHALTVVPGRADSATLEEVQEPPKEDGSILVEARAVGVRGTDREIVAGEYGEAWDHIERIGRRARVQPESVLVTGAGPIGILAALLGVQRRLSVLLDRVQEGPKPSLVREVGASYHVGQLETLCQEADIVLECTGVPSVIFSVLSSARPSGIICLTGVSSGGFRVPVIVFGEVG